MNTRERERESKRLLLNLNFCFIKTVAVFFCAGFLFFGLVGQASATTYYVSPTGSNTSPYDTWAKAATAVNTIFTAFDMASGDIIEIDGGASGITYSAAGTAVINVGTNDGGITIRGSSETGRNGTVTIDGTVNANHAIYVPLGAASVTVENLTVRASLASKCLLLYDTTTINDVDIDGSLCTTTYPIFISGAPTITIRRSRLKNQAYYNFIYCQSGAVTLNIDHCICSGYTGSSASNNFIRFTYAGSTLNSSNNIYTDITRGVIQCTLGTANFKNDMIFGTHSGKVTGDSDLTRIFSAAAGQTINVNNTLICTNGRFPNSASIYSSTGTITLTDCILQEYPKIIKHKYGGYVSFVLDDSVYSDVMALKAVADSHGVQMSIAIDQQSVLISDAWAGTEAEVKTMILAIHNSGHEIVNHTISHPNLVNANAFLVSYIGAGANPRIVISGTYPTLTLICRTDSGDDITLNMTDSTYIRSGAGAPQLAIDAHADWVAANDPNATAYTKAKGLKVGTILITGADIPILLDISTNYTHWIAEITDMTTWLESFLGVNTTKVFVIPGGGGGVSYSQSLQDWLNANISTTHAGGARTMRPEEYTSPVSTLISNNLYMMGIGALTSARIVLPNKDTATEATVRGNARSVFTWIAETGNLGIITLHTAEITPTQFGYILDEFNKSQNLTAMKFGDLVAYIRANWTDLGSGYFGRTLTDNSNFTFQSTSPAIDSGTNVSLTTDYAGNSIYGVPDIGAYEYQPPYTIGTDDAPTTGSIRIYSDGKYRMKTASTTSATANFNIIPQGGSYQSTTTQYMDITIDSWLTSGTYNKQWTATSTAGDFLTLATSTTYTIGDLAPNTYYQFKVDGSASSTAITGSSCNSNGTCLSNSSGVVTFTYSGGYSTHTFALEKDTTGPAAFALSSPANNSSTSNSQPTLSWNASSDSESGLSHYQLYIDNGLDTNNISGTSVAPASALSCVNHSWYVKAIDNAGNSTNSGTFNLTMVCGGTAVWMLNQQTSPQPSPSQGEGEQAADNNTDNGIAPSSDDRVTKDKNIIEQIIGLIKIIAQEASEIVKADVNVILSKIGFKRDLNLEKTAIKNYVRPLAGQAGDKTKYSITNFIAYGTPTTLRLGKGERAGVVNSYKSSFNKLPTAQSEWEDVIKIANGRWPSETNQKTEQNASAAFRKIYLREPDRNNINDDAAITIIAYGLRPACRNMDSEKKAIQIFKNIYGYNPFSATAWDIVRAIAYSGATR